LLVLIGPGALGAGVTQVNIFIDMVLASLLPAGAVSYLAYSERLFQLPIGVIGIAVGTALLPILSHVVRTAEPAKAHDEQNRAIEFGLWLALPAAVALVVIPDAILRVLFERGAFTAEVTYYTAWAVSAYALSIPAYTVSKVLTVAFYAREDTKSPFKISLVTVVLNTLFSLVVITALRHSSHADIAHAGLALSTGITAWLNVALLVRRLKRAGYFAADRDFMQRIAGVAASGAAMGLVLWGGVRLLDPWLHGILPVKAAALGGLIAVAAVVYLALAHITGAQRLDEVKKLLRRRQPKDATPPSAPES